MVANRETRIDDVETGISSSTVVTESPVTGNPQEDDTVNFNHGGHGEAEDDGYDDGNMEMTSLLTSGSIGENLPTRYDRHSRNNKIDFMKNFSSTNRRSNVNTDDNSPQRQLRHNQHDKKMGAAGKKRPHRREYDNPTDAVPTLGDSSIENASVANHSRFYRTFCSCCYWKGFKSTLQCMNVIAKVVLWCTALALVLGVVWYSYELHNHGTDPHLIAWFSAGAFVILGFPVSMWGIVGHLASYNQPSVQVYIVRILAMVPIYSIESWLAMRFHKQAIYIETLRDFYESYVLYSFLQFLIEVLGGEENLVNMLKDKSPTRGVHMWGVQWCVKPWLMGQPELAPSKSAKTSTTTPISSAQNTNSDLTFLNSVNSASIDEETDVVNVGLSSHSTMVSSVSESPNGANLNSQSTSNKHRRSNKNRPSHQQQQQKQVKRVYWKSPFFVKCKFGVLQYVLLKLVSAIAVLLLEWKGWYREGHFDYKSGYFYVCFFTNVSQCWALYCLILFYYATKTELSPMRPVGKFLSVKALVFFTWWQSVFISVLYQMDMIPNYAEDWTPEDVAKGIQDYLICVEMFIAAVVHTFVFPHTDYSPAAVEARIRALHNNARSSNFYGNEHVVGRKRLGRHKLHSQHYYTKHWKENHPRNSGDESGSKNSNITPAYMLYSGINDENGTVDSNSIQSVSLHSLNGNSLEADESNIIEVPNSLHVSEGVGKSSSAMHSMTMNRKDSFPVQKTTAPLRHNEGPVPLSNKRPTAYQRSRSFESTDNYPLNNLPLDTTTMSSQPMQNTTDFLSPSSWDHKIKGDECRRDTGMNNSANSLNEEEYYSEGDDHFHNESYVGNCSYSTSKSHELSPSSEGVPPTIIQRPGFVRALLDTAIPRDLGDNTVGILTGEFHVEKKTLLHHAATSDQYDLFANRRQLRVIPKTNKK